MNFSRCDDAGKNKAFQCRLKSIDQSLNVKLEYWKQHLSREPHLLEMRLHAISSRGKVIMNGDHVPRIHPFVMEDDISNNNAS